MNEKEKTALENKIRNLIRDRKNEELKQTLETKYYYLKRLYPFGFLRFSYQSQKTFLHEALEKKNFEAADMLFNSGIFDFITEKDKAANYYNSLFIRPILENEEEKVKEAFQKIHKHNLSPICDIKNPAVPNDLSKQPVYNAIMTCNWNFVKLIADIEPKSLDVRDYCGASILQHLISRHDYPEILEELRQRGVNLLEYDDTKESNLNIAARNHRIKTVKYLIELGADPNIKDPGGNNALHEFCYVYDPLRKEDDETLHLLLSKMKDVDTQGKNYTPLQIALRYNNSSGSLKMAKILLEHGADLNKENVCGFNAVASALRKGIVFVELMEKEKLLDFSYRNLDGQNYLMLFLRSEQNSSSPEIQRVVDFILFAAEHGLNFNERDNDGKTVLDYVPRDNARIRKGYKKIESMLKSIMKDQQQEEEETFSDIGF